MLVYRNLVSRCSRFCLVFGRRFQSLLLRVDPGRFLLSAALYSCGEGFKPGRRIDFINPGRISIGDNFSSGSGVRIHAWASYQGIQFAEQPVVLLRIGSGVFINDNSYVTCAFGVSIGDNCLFGSNVLVSDNSHGPTCASSLPRLSLPLHSKGPVHIGPNVWLCNNVVITSGVTIGANSIIAANSVVTSDVPEGSLFGGIPARFIRFL